MRISIFDAAVEIEGGKGRAVDILTAMILDVGGAGNLGLRHKSLERIRHLGGCGVRIGEGCVFEVRVLCLGVGLKN